MTFLLSISCRNDSRFKPWLFFAMFMYMELFTWLKLFCAFVLLPFVLLFTAFHFYFLPHFWYNFFIQKSKHVRQFCCLTNCARQITYLKWQKKWKVCWTCFKVEGRTPKKFNSNILSFEYTSYKSYSIAKCRHLGVVHKWYHNYFQQFDSFPKSPLFCKMLPFFLNFWHLLPKKWVWRHL